MEYREDPGWRDQLDPEARKWFEGIVLDIGVDAEALAPVDTGALKQSIDAEVFGDVGRVGSNLHYAGYVEDGHRVAYRGSDGQIHYTGTVVPPQGYLRPALYRKRG